MPGFLIEVPHGSGLRACAEVVEVFLRSGSHIMTNAGWGCMDDDHTARILMDVDTKDQARAIANVSLIGDLR